MRVSASVAIAVLAQAGSLEAVAAAPPLPPDACVSDACGASGGPAREHLLLQVGRPGERPALALIQEPLSWRTSGQTSGDGQWCQASAPAADWSLKRCSADGGQSREVKVLTYNLFWWNLFGSYFRNGNGGSAGKLIAANGMGAPYDFMGFQECDDVGRVLADAGLEQEYAAVGGQHAVAIAYRTSEWRLLSQGMAEVAEDRPEQWWGTRGALWARFQHIVDGKTVLFVNHHGPLPVGTGGRCGKHATAWNILRTIATHGEEGDGIILVGDFNADAGTTTIQELEARLHRVFTGASFGGVDHIFSNCGESRVVVRRNLGNGGSDHDALDAVITL